MKEPVPALQGFLRFAPELEMPSRRYPKWLLRATRAGRTVISLRAYRPSI